MTQTGQITLTDCAYFPSYSVKCIFCFITFYDAFDDVMKLEYLKF